MENPSISAALFSENIGAAIDWKIKRSRHVLIVHLAGRMDTLHTEIDGHCTSVGPALAGEYWLIPAGSCYASAASGGAIRFAEVEFDEDALANITTQSRIAAFSDPIGARYAVAIAQGDREAATALSIRLDSILARRRELVQVFRFTPTRLSDICNFIEARLENPMCLRDLADFAGCSPNAFITAFTASMGETPAQYLIRQRLRRAKWLLLHSNMDITSIAMQTGFSSHSHLTSLFTSRIGIAPRKWRNMEKVEQSHAA